MLLNYRYTLYATIIICQKKKHFTILFGNASYAMTGAFAATAAAAAATHVILPVLEYERKLK